MRRGGGLPFVAAPRLPTAPRISAGHASATELTCLRDWRCLPGRADMTAAGPNRQAHYATAAIVKLVSDFDKPRDRGSSIFSSEGLTGSRMTFGKRVDGPGGRRRDERISTSLQAQLITPTETIIGTLTDISSTGARFHGLKTFPVGRLVMVRIEKLEAFGTIVWRTHEFCGVDFKPPVDDDERQTITNLVNLCREAVGNQGNN